MWREREDMMSYQQWHDRPVRGQAYKGLLSGLLGGLVACWAMNQWLALWQRVVEGETATRRGQPVAGQGGQLSQEGPDERQPPTMHAAAKRARLGGVGHPRYLVAVLEDTNGGIKKAPCFISTAAIFRVAARSCVLAYR